MKKTTAIERERSYKREGVSFERLRKWTFAIKEALEEENNAIEKSSVLE